MRNQYSDSPAGEKPLTLALDTGSPVTSVALGRGGRLLAARETRGGRSSSRLLALVDDLLAAHGFAARDVARLIAARGPGSFTGLRVGLATALGLHQALGARATAVSTLAALARGAAAAGDPRPLVAVVDALRGEWFAQAFADGGLGPALGEPAVVGPERLAGWAPCRLTGFDLERLPATALAGGAIEPVAAAALAPALLALAEDPDLAWDPAPLVAPLYLRPPAAMG